MSEPATVVMLLASPSDKSRSTAIARIVAARLEDRGIASRSFSIRDFDAADVMFARAGAPTVATFLQSVRSSAGLVLSTPVYKATYSGALKAVVDLIPPDALVGKAMLGLGTSKLPTHGGDLEKAYGALAGFFRAGHYGSAVVLDDELTWSDGAPTLTAAAQGRLGAAVDALSSALETSRF